MIDTHAHLDALDDPHGAIARARAAGVGRIVAIASGLASTRATLALAEDEEGVAVAAGVHPHQVADGESVEELAALAGAKVVAIGEIGLDFYRDLSPRDAQVRVFRRQLETAARVSKPVAVHARDAHTAMLPLIDDWSREMRGALPDGRPLGVMHYFSGDAALALRYIELGFVISIHTSVTHPKATQLVDVARQVPLEHLVLETDSPYGAPQSHRGKRNEPAYVAAAAEKVAEIKSVTVERVAAITTANALVLFGLQIAASAASGKDGR